VDVVVRVRGRTSKSEEESKVLAEEVAPLDSFLGGELHLKLDGLETPVLDQVQLILNSHSGSSPVILYMENGKKVRAGEQYRVALGAALLKRLEEFLGPARVKVKRDYNTLAHGNGGPAPGSGTVPQAGKTQEDSIVKPLSTGEAVSVTHETMPRAVPLTTRSRKAKTFFSLLEL
jgi:hypothetical protein